MGCPPTKEALPPAQHHALPTLLRRVVIHLHSAAHSLQQQTASLLAQLSAQLQAAPSSRSQPQEYALLEDIVAKVHLKTSSDGWR